MTSVLIIFSTDVSKHPNDLLLDFILGLWLEHFEAYLNDASVQEPWNQLFCAWCHVCQNPERFKLVIRSCCILGYLCQIEKDVVVKDQVQWSIPDRHDSSNADKTERLFPVRIGPKILDQLGKSRSWKLNLFHLASEIWTQGAWSRLHLCYSWSVG